MWASNLKSGFKLSQLGIKQYDTGFSLKNCWSQTSVRSISSSVIPDFHSFLISNMIIVKMNHGSISTSVSSISSSMIPDFYLKLLISNMIIVKVNFQGITLIRRPGFGSNYGQIGIKQYESGFSLIIDIKFDYCKSEISGHCFNSKTLVWFQLRSERYEAVWYRIFTWNYYRKILIINMIIGKVKV